MVAGKSRKSSKGVRTLKGKSLPAGQAKGVKGGTTIRDHRAPVTMETRNEVRDH